MHSSTRNLFFFAPNPLPKPFYISLIPKPITIPQSQYRKTVYPPIQDVDEERRELILHRARWEDGERDKDLVNSLLDIGEWLGEHCEFLETKLNIKIRTLPT